MGKDKLQEVALSTAGVDCISHTANILVEVLVGKGAVLDRSIVIFSSTVAILCQAHRLPLMINIRIMHIGCAVYLLDQSQDRTP